MEKEDAVNVLQFWLAADNFQSQLAAKKGQYDGQEAQNDAMILYDKWGNSTVTCFWSSDFVLVLLRCTVQKELLTCKPHCAVVHCYAEMHFIKVAFDVYAQNNF